MHGEDVLNPSENTRFRLPQPTMSHGTSSGGCVVGRCWEACPSWVPASLSSLPWLAGWTQGFYIIIALNRGLEGRKNRANLKQGRAGQRRAG